MPATVLIRPHRYAAMFSLGMGLWFGYIYIGLACQLDQGNGQVIPTVVPPCRHGLQPNLIIKHESGYGTVLTHAHR